MTFTLALIVVKILFACFDKQSLTAVGAKRLQRKAGKSSLKSINRQFSEVRNLRRLKSVAGKN
ncbi:MULTISPECIES: hypothetical protein [Chryseobacterium]|uniref:Uncharacterized protein n=1 Tax=Chryseobacterium nepalense TaxID=1854498 RepID=A0ABY4K885_9FLAO|nr:MULTISPECIES: hypothetical protein [Chryseobacterium]MEA1850644.1 hypothetical protein [Chryseobacterium sp. MHB01]UPQ76739.1 hypothetical protein M0D58_04105 [Chryseobacterium nepalense]